MLVMVHTRPPVQGEDKLSPIIDKSWHNVTVRGTRKAVQSHSQSNDSRIQPVSGVVYHQTPTLEKQCPRGRKQRKSIWRESPQNGVSPWSFHFRKKLLEIKLGIPSRVIQSREIVKSKNTPAPMSQMEDVLRISELRDAQKLNKQSRGFSDQYCPHTPNVGCPRYGTGKP